LVRNARTTVAGFVGDEFLAMTIPHVRMEKAVS
jgi:hypothetical protein